MCGVKGTAMRVWLRLTWLFGLPDDQPPENLMVAALGPILHAAGRDLAEAPLPPKIQKLLDELSRDQPSRASGAHRNFDRHTPKLDPIPNAAPNGPELVQHP
jgi:hypothetical protein